MMEQRRTLIVTGLVLLLLIGLVGAVIYFLVGFIKPKSSTGLSIFPKSSVVATPSPYGASLLPSASDQNATGFPKATSVPIATTSPVNGTSKGGVVSQNTKLYQGKGFQLSYPANWGLLTCNNSSNFEFDPINSTDQNGFPCDRAVKPITVIVGQSTCSGGTTVNLSGVSVRKIVTQNVRTSSGGNGTEYHWCTNTTPALDITHRVGSGPAFSSQDYSAQVEQMIATLRQGS